VRQIRLLPVAILAAVIMSSLVACSQPVSKSGYKGNEFIGLHEEMKEYIETARATIVQLETFSWDELEDIGIESPPAGLCILGACVIKKEAAVSDSGNMWTPLIDMLPRAESSTPLKIYCDKCLEMSVKIRTQKPASDNLTPAAAETDPDIAQWQDQCHQLEDTLSAAENLAWKYATTAESTFKDLEESFEKSDDRVRKQYLPKFRNKCAEYADSLDWIIRNLQYARSNLAEIAGWEDYAVGIGTDESVKGKNVY